jgi:hypothetical protein
MPGSFNWPLSFRFPNHNPVCASTRRTVYLILLTPDSGLNIHPSTPGYSKWSLSFGFPHQSPECTSAWRNIFFFISKFRPVLDLVYFLCVFPWRQIKFCRRFGTLCLWRWTWQRAPKRRQNLIWRRGKTQKKIHNEHIFYFTLFTRDSGLGCLVACGYPRCNWPPLPNAVTSSCVTKHDDDSACFYSKMLVRLLWINRVNGNHILLLCAKIMHESFHV